MQAQNFIRHIFMQAQNFIRHIGSLFPNQGSAEYF
jgi:hypothetical protein